jgi:DNA-directed RNA polymerase subunit RPC12/RpoP
MLKLETKAPKVEGPRMVEQIVRCPYCVLDNELRPMLQRPDWYVCEQCGHTVIPDDPEFKCSCEHCTQLHRAA